MSKEEEVGPHPGPLPHAGEGEELRVSPNKNRLVQVRRTGGRKLFDKARKEKFLEWFAATCNVRLSAEQAGVSDKTVFKHLLKDAAFEEAFGRALRLGYVRIEARSVQEALAPARPPLPAHAAHESPSPARGEGDDRSTIASSGNGPPPLPAAEEEYEVRAGLDDPRVEERFDAQLALHLLREHARRLSGSADKGKAQRTTARAATNAEIADALAKRLKHFGLRAAREQNPFD